MDARNDLTKLPDEVLSVVVSSLNPPDLTAAARTSKRLKNIAEREMQARKAGFLEKIAAKTVTADDCANAIETLGDSLETDMEPDQIKAALESVLGEDPRAVIPILQAAARRQQPVDVRVDDEKQWPSFQGPRSCKQIGNCATLGRGAAPGGDGRCLIVIDAPGADRMALRFEVERQSGSGESIVLSDWFAACTACSTVTVDLMGRTPYYKSHLIMCTYTDDGNDTEFFPDEETAKLKLNAGLSHFLYALLFITTLRLALRQSFTDTCCI